MAAPAERLQVFERPAQLGMGPLRLDVVDLEPAHGAAFTAAEPIALQSQVAEPAPAFRARGCPRMAEIALHTKTSLAGRGAGLAAILAPSLTAKIAADTESIRPVLLALASLELPAGSFRQTASPSAERINRLGAHRTLPS